MKNKRLFIATLTTFIGIVLILTAIQPRAEAATILPSANQANEAQQADTCQTILTRAVQTLNSNCDKLDRNKACYGNVAIDAELRNPGAKFNASGDKVPIQTIRKITASQLDLQHGTWGLSLLKLQANLPDTMPGQNVMFLIFGNISLENNTGNMQAFYFTSGLGNPTCKEAPRDGILVKSPEHTEVTFKANGVQITIASTILLRAEQNKTLDVVLFEGHARVTSPQGTQTLQPGQMVSVPLGGNNGLEPVGKPSVPIAYMFSPAEISLITAMQPLAPLAAPINTSIEGCITDIQGNTAIIQGQMVQFSPRDPVLGSAKVGDCFLVTGSIQSNGTNPAVVPSHVNAPNRPGNDTQSGNGDQNTNDAGQGNNTSQDGKDTGNDKGNSGNGLGNGGGDGSNGGGNDKGNSGNGQGNGGGDGSNGGGNGQDKK